MELLKPILYYSIFKYPLKKEEVFLNANYATANEFENELKLALDRNFICETKNYYSLPEDLNIILKREKGNFDAKSAMVIAYKKAEFVSKYFPFIEAIGISGSLSKGYFDDNSDVDFFIITKPSRLWFCRTMLIVYKKLFLFNSKKYFCMNYFISSDNLDISERNRFTATEITTLLPLYGKEIFEQFYKTNIWVKSYFPNKIIDAAAIKTIQKSRFTAIFENILNNKIGELLENFFFKITYSHWKKKFKKSLGSDFELAFKSSNKVSKHHPQNFQNKVISSLNMKYDLINKKHNLSLEKEYV